MKRLLGYIIASTMTKDNNGIVEEVGRRTQRPVETEYRMLMLKGRENPGPNCKEAVVSRVRSMLLFRFAL